MVVRILMDEANVATAGMTRGHHRFNTAGLTLIEMGSICVNQH